MIILPVNTLMQRVCPHEFLHGYALVLKKGQRLPRDKLRSQLEQAGYRSAVQVMAHGEFATRGALFDLYPMGSKEPYRIDFSDDEIDSQRTLSEVNAINLLPAHEFLTNKNAIELFRSQWREQFDVRRDPEHIYQQVSKGTWPAGAKYWQPLFFSQPLPSLFSYLPANTLIVNTGNLENAATRFWLDISQRYQSRRIDPMRLPLAPDTLWLRVDALFGELKAWPRIALENVDLAAQAGNTNLGYRALPDLVAVQAQNKLPLDNLHRFVADFDGSVIFSVESEGRRETLQDLLGGIKLGTSLIQDPAPRSGTADRPLYDGRRFRARFL